MFLFYIDESGTGLHDNNSPHFLLSAVAIRSEDWPVMDNEVSSLKQRLISFAEPEDWEIKGRTIRQGQELFSNKNWPERAKIFLEIAGLMSELPCKIFMIQVDKRLLPRSVDSNEKLYQFAFWRLLDELNGFLNEKRDNGLMMIDARSNLHTSVQDRRLVDAYRKWLGLHSNQTKFVDLPWFGFSEFYAGLQIADFVAYLTDFSLNENQTRTGSAELRTAFECIQSKIQFFTIP